MPGNGNSVLITSSRTEDFYRVLGASYISGHVLGSFLRLLARTEGEGLKPMYNAYLGNIGAVLGASLFVAIGLGKGIVRMVTR